VARYPGRPYTHDYGPLKVTAVSKEGTYVVTVRRPSDGYEVTIDTLERNPLEASRYALDVLATAWKMMRARDVHLERFDLRRAAEEIGQDAFEVLEQIVEGEN